MGLQEDVLRFHGEGPPRTIEVISSKTCATRHGLSLVNAPGVAQPCLEIVKNCHDADRYTVRGNLVAVVSSGTAVLHLGNIGALAGKPFMEGKHALFKRFADGDVFDIAIESEDPEEAIRGCQLLEPTFLGEQYRGHQGTRVLLH